MHSTVLHKGCMQLLMQWLQQTSVAAAVWCTWGGGGMYSTVQGLQEVAS